MSKAEKTTNYIIEKVAPLFNKNGYEGTSLSDITSATGLTKGAVYGNFESKEALALQAFNHNIRKVFNHLNKYVDREKTVLGKLKAITNFYRNYPILTSELGGCPLLNVGIDTHHCNELLHSRVKEVNEKLKRNMSNLLQAGIDNKEIKDSIDTKRFAGLLIGMIEGGVYMSFIHNDDTYMFDMMDHLDSLIDNELKR